MSAFSVVIPTHERPLLLRDALASVAAQTLPAAEVIVVDDAEDWATRETVAQAQQSAKIPVRYIPNPRPGVCNSRNLGVDAAGSGLVAFLDDDDMWRPQFLEKVGATLSAEEVAFAMSGLFRQMPDGAVVPRVMPSGLTPATSARRPGSMTGSNFIIRREVFAAVGGFDPSVTVFNDWDLFIRLVDGGYRYAVVDEPLAEWRHHPGPRIATPSLTRADGLRHFLSVHGSRMDKDVWRDFKTMEIGIRRRHATTPVERWMRLFQLAHAHGFRRTMSRLRRRTRI